MCRASAMHADIFFQAMDSFQNMFLSLSGRLECLWCGELHALKFGLTEDRVHVCLLVSKGWIALYSWECCKNLP